MMRGRQDEEMRAGHSLPSWLRKLRAPNWGHVNNIPAWPELYHEVWRVNELRWGDPNTRELRNLDIIDQMWDKFGIAAECIVRDLRELQWEHVSADDLILLYETHLIVEIGIWSLAPVEISDLRDRRMLFFDTLIRKDILDGIGASIIRPKLAVNAFIGYCAWPWVETEIVRRGALNIGSHAAILKLCFALAEEDKARFVFDEALVASQKRLEQAIFNNLRPRLQFYPPWQQIDTRNEIPGWIAQVFNESQYKKLDPLQALVDGMDGNLNIFPRRVANRIGRSLKKSEHDAARANGYTREDLDDPKNKQRFEKALRFSISDDTGKTEMEDRDLLEKFLKEHPKHEIIARVTQSDEPQKVLAERLAIPLRTFKRQLQRYRDDFSCFVKRQ